MWLQKTNKFAKERQTSIGASFERSTRRGLSAAHKSECAGDDCLTNSCYSFGNGVRGRVESVRFETAKLSEFPA